MRRFALTTTTFLTLAALCATSVADEADFKPFPKRSLALGVQGHGTRIGGRSEGGFGTMLELALGRGRWQYLVEASIASSGRNEWTTPALETRVDGKLARGGLGLRWLARQFSPDDSGALELFLTSMVGLQRFYFDDNGRLTRPEVALGFGIQGRVFKRPRITFRLDARVLFTPNDNESALVACRGTCMNETGSSTGFLTGMALAW